jgi:chromosome segregation ATPase
MVHSQSWDPSEASLLLVHIKAAEKLATMLETMQYTCSSDLHKANVSLTELQQQLGPLKSKLTTVNSTLGECNNRLSAAKSKLDAQNNAKHGLEITLKQSKDENIFFRQQVHDLQAELHNEQSFCKEKGKELYMFSGRFLILLMFG